MIKSKTLFLFLSFAFLALVIGCSKSDDDNGTTNPSGNGDSDPEARISTYEFTFSGGNFDGQTISGSFPNDIYHGGGWYVDAEEDSLSSKNAVTIDFNDPYEQEVTGSMSGVFLLNENAEALPIGDSYDIDSLSTFEVTIHTDDSSLHENDVSYDSVSGTCTVSNVVVSSNLSGPAYSDYDAEFEGVFDSGEGEVTITGELHIRSIRVE